MSIDPTRTAVVLIEYQNDFTSEGGALHGAVQDVGAHRHARQDARPDRRCAGGRRHDRPRADHVRRGLRQAVRPSVRDPQGRRDSTAFVKGSWGAEIVDAVAPQPGDIVVEGKRGLDAFATTNLDFILRARGITTIALGGFT